MCCFTGAVESVNNTNLFARSVEKGRQLLVYSMNFRAKADLAMILPLPVPPGSPEDAVRFIDLKGYPEFFTDLKRGFPEPILRGPPAGSGGEPTSVAKSAPLEVVQVGEFEASFVPTVKDFVRLDARFRLPDQAWDALPACKDYGFAVFKLKKETSSPHPMAFEFPRADAKRIFFPTVHIHDGQVHGKAVFDHTLYCQKREGERTSLPDWRESDHHASSFLQIDKTQGIVDGASHCYQKKVRGERKNEDILV
jgi:hypothetical protein